MDDPIKRIKEIDDSARNSLGRLAPVLLGLSLLALQAPRPFEAVGWLVASWITFGTATVLSALGEVVIQEWAHRWRDTGTFERRVNQIALVLVVAGVINLIVFAVANVD